MKTPIIERLQAMRTKSGLSFAALEEITGISSSTICRWLKGEGAPGIDDIYALVDAMKGNIQELFAAVGEQEITATQGIGYQGAVAMQEHYETLLAVSADKLQMIQSHHEQALQSHRENYDRNVSYLKEQLIECKNDRAAHQLQIDSLNQRLTDLDRRRHHVFWGMLSALIVVSVGFVIALFSNSIV